MRLPPVNFDELERRLVGKTIIHVGRSLVEDERHARALVLTLNTDEVIFLAVANERKIAPDQPSLFEKP